MKARQEVTAVTGGRYRGASKKEKRLLLDQFVSTTGYSRWYARFVLRHQGRRLQADKQTILLAVSGKCRVRKRTRLYDEKVVTALLKLWRVMDYICGKRLQPILPELLVVLERQNGFTCDPQTRAKLLRISAGSARVSPDPNHRPRPSIRFDTFCRSHFSIRPTQIAHG